MKIFLVRHGKTVYNEKGIVQGTLPVCLSKTGEMKCYELKNKIKDIHFDICLCSPIFRAVQTAMILIGDRVEIEKEDILREREIKCLEGMSKEEIEQLKERKGKEDGIEQNDQVFERCKEFANLLKEKYKNENILVVSHGIVIACLHYILNDYNISFEDIEKDLNKKNIENCYFEEIEIK